MKVKTPKNSPIPFTLAERFVCLGIPPHLLNPQAPADVDSLTSTVKAVLDLVAKEGVSALNLSGLMAHGVHCEHLASVLRATFAWKEEVPGWHEALGVARAACALAGEQAEDVLFGMT